MTFQSQILAGIPDTLPQKKAYDLSVNHAPKTQSHSLSGGNKTGTQKCIAVF